MKKLFYILLITQLTIGLSYSQSGWFWQNPLPQGNNLFNIQMLNISTGYCWNWDNIVKTTDEGETWTLLYTGFPSNNNSMYMVDALTGYVILDSSKLIKTTNGGNSWFFVSNLAGVFIPIWGFQSLYFTSQNTGFIFNQMDANYLRGTRLQRTTNAGVNWSTQIADTSFELFTMDFPSPIVGYIAGRKSLWAGSYYHLKIFKTTNAGTTWDSVQNTINMDARCVEFINENTGFVGGQLSYSGGRLLKTTNGGTSWILNNFNFQGYVHDIFFTNQSVGFILNGDGKLFKTTNSGENWLMIDVSQVIGLNSHLTSIYFSDLNKGIAAGICGLIAKTTNGGVNWTKKSRGTDNWLWDVKFSNVNTGFASGDYGTLLKTTNGGINWELTQFYQFDDIGPIAPVNSNLWFAASSPEGKIFKTTNTGITWDTLYTGLYAISRLEFINQNTGFGICKYNTFFKTTNGGTNWLIYNNLNYSQNWAMDFIDENTGYAGTKVAKTTNGGLNWDTLSFGLEFGVSDIQFLNLNTGYISGASNDYYGYTGYVMKTTNGSASWIPVIVSTIGPIEDLYFINENTGYCSGWEGVFKTTNSGQSWYQIRTCSNNSGKVIFFTESLTGYIVGAGGSIIKTTTGGEPIGIQPISSEVPQQFILHQNYPNPFNPSTKIKFSIPPSKGARGMTVRLLIYDILGREVAVLVNEQLNAGVYEVEWNASNFSSGIYFYQLNITDASAPLSIIYSETKKMVLLK